MYKGTWALASLGVLAATAAEGASSKFAEEVLEDQPVGFWRLAEPLGASQALDSAMNLHGTYRGGDLLQEWDTPGADSGVLFEGARVVVPHDRRLDVTEVTVESVVILSERSELLTRIAEKSTENSNTSALYGLMVSPEGRAVFEYTIESRKRSLESSTVLDLGRIHHVAATFDGMVARLYVDGNLDGEAELPGLLTRDTTRGLAIGNQVNRDRPFMGVIDEVAVYDHALSAERIRVHYRALRLFGDLRFADPVGCGCDAIEVANRDLDLLLLSMVFVALIIRRR